MRLQNSRECFEGRVKTLNPYIHGGILHRRDKQSHLDQAKELGVEGIDLVCGKPISVLKLLLKKQMILKRLLKT